LNPLTNGTKVTQAATPSRRYVTYNDILYKISMKLFIDTSDSEKIVVGIDDKRFETVARKDKSQKLLPFINELIKKKGKTIKDISEIEVNCGPGSFTGLRVGISIAQTLGWALGIPVNGKDIKKGESIEVKYE